MNSWIVPWLKGTIPGIIILGAIGSLIAVLILYIANVVAFKLVPTGRKALWKARAWRAWSEGCQYARAYDARDPRVLMTFLAYKISRMLFLSLLSIVALVTGLAILLRQEAIYLSAASYGAILLSFFLMERAFFELLTLKWARDEAARPESEKRPAAAAVVPDAKSGTI